MIEERVAALISEAITAGEIEGVATANVMTDAAGYTEWHEEPKIYVIRKSTTTLPDMSGAEEYDTELVLSVMAVDKLSAQNLMAAVWPVIQEGMQQVEGLSDWCPTELDAAPFFDGQVFRDQYYVIRKMRVIHTVF